MIVSGIFLGVFLLIFFLGRKEEREALRELKKEKKVLWWPTPVACIGLWLHRLIQMLLRISDDGGRILFENENRRRARFANVYGGAYLLCLSGALLGLGVSIYGNFSGTILSIERPEFGETSLIEAVAEEAHQKEDVLIQISGRTPAEEEMQVVFDAEYERLLEKILNGNESFSNVQTRLSFPSETESGIRLSFESEKPEVLSDFGSILAEEIPEEGIPLRLQVSLTYGEAAAEYILPVQIFPKKEVLSERERIEAEIRAADEAQKGENVVVLPKSVAGEPITFGEKQMSGGKILSVFLLMAMLLVAALFAKEKEKRREREEELELTYAKLVAKYVSYLDAGLSIRNSWMKIAEDYKTRRREGCALSFAYEEMVVTANEMNGGKPERQAYGDFGRRIGLHSYVKFTNLLSQNLKQGVSGLKQALQEEALTSQEARKNAALKKGEEAGTKQLFPMLLMLGIVIVALIVPVFLSF